MRCPICGEEIKGSYLEHMKKHMKGQPLRRRIKIYPSHDWFYAEVNGEYYLSGPKHDGVVSPQEWVKEMLKIQEMSPEEFLKEYDGKKITDPEEIMDIKRYPPRFWSKEELERRIGLIRWTHGY